MKVIFRISGWLGLILAGGLVSWAINHPGTMREGSPVASPGMVAPVANPPAMVPPTPAPAAPAPFHWSQLDASDYHVYVQNLRAIGCPEPSVRAIVTADVAAVFDQRRRRLEQKLADLKGGSWSAQLESANEQQSIQGELQAIPGGITAMINDLLGIKPSPVATAPAAAPVTLPLALQTFDLTALKLDSGQLQAMQDLRQRFLDQTGGTAPDPNDALAVARWQKALAESDDQMAGFLGSEAYQNMQLQALANAQAGKSGR